MQVSNGNVDTLENIQKELSKTFSNDLVEEKMKNDVVPIPHEYSLAVKRWGYKKRDQYRNLINNGMTQKEAFHRVEFHGGK